MTDTAVDCMYAPMSDKQRAHIGRTCPRCSGPARWQAETMGTMKYWCDAHADWTRGINPYFDPEAVDDGSPT